MPTNHIKQWHHNRGFISTIDPQYPDWAVTATFYTALHAVDALFKYDKVEGVVSHEARNRTLARTSRYAKIWRNYSPLYGLARTVRYFANPAKWVSWEQVEGEVFRRFLYPLEKSVLGLMAEKDHLPAIVIKPLADQANPSK